MKSANGAVVSHKGAMTTLTRSAARMMTMEKRYRWTVDSVKLQMRSNLSDCSVKVR
jgi:hypothetical protein